MKKIVLASLLMLAIAGSVSAQDTIHSKNVKPNYLVGWNWPQFNNNYGYLQMRECGPMMNGEAFRIMTNDTLTIYGIAASMSTIVDLRPEHCPNQVQHPEYYYLDTTYKEVYDLLCLFANEADTNLRVISEKLKVHIRFTPIDYYLDLGIENQYNHDTCPLLPFYERYFDSAVTVVDSFYIGRLCHTNLYAASGGYTNTIGVVLNTVADNVAWIPIKVVEHCDYEAEHPDDSSYWKWHFYPEDWGLSFTRYFPLIFPILTPQPDTTNVDPPDTIVGGDTTRVDPDTLGIQSPELLKRYTSVQPNPATETAKVISSFGLTCIEAFNSAGDRVYDAPHTGLTATLDVSRWPAGTYILRLHTPAGTVGKKLIVRR